MKPVVPKKAGTTGSDQNARALARDLSGRLRGKKIAVVMGGVSAEREISLLTGRAVLKALHGEGLLARGVDVRGARQLCALAQQRPAVAFIALHGAGGEDGSIQGFLQWAGIPYTGSGILASAVAMDKARAKQVFSQAGLPTAPWALLSSPEARIPSRLKWPLVIKPNRQGSAIGVSVVRTAQDLTQALAQARRYDHEILVEKFVAGREISIGVLSGRALPVIEIVPKKTFYDYEAKYVAGMSEHIIPARLSPAVTRQVQLLAESAHAVLGCRGASRVDLIVPPRGKAVILEVNTIPGMTATSLLPDAARQVGLGFSALVMSLILEALGERP